MYIDKIRLRTLICDEGTSAEIRSLLWELYDLRYGKTNYTDYIELENCVSENISEPVSENKEPVWHTYPELPKISGEYLVKGYYEDDASLNTYTVLQFSDDVNEFIMENNGNFVIEKWLENTNTYKHQHNGL